ncbi:hypothetical protein Pfo_001911 [Paulownia fortunei]|nr:hypothetical protein Pfo_001911 [Paulownia fortunei]
MGGDDDGHNMNGNDGYEFSEDNADNLFWNEITLYRLDSTSDASITEVDPILVISSIVQMRNGLKKHSQVVHPLVTTRGTPPINLYNPPKSNTHGALNII